MKKTILIGGTAAALVTLAGCVHVAEGHHSDLDEIAVNTDTALRVCGEYNVKEVTEDGFECKSED